MRLLTAQDRVQLLTSGALRREAQRSNPDCDIDFLPVVKRFTPDANCTSLIRELDADTHRAFGLCNLGLAFPELGYVSLTELSSVRGRFNLPVERDRHVAATKPLSASTTDGRAARRITA